jgi:hypothetical protein
MTTYKWESSVRRYRDRSTGRFLSRKTVADLTLLRIKQVTEDLQKLGDSLITGESTLRQWQQQFAESLKILHTQQFLLGVGGDSQIKDRDYKTISDILFEQYQYLQNFATELTQGKVSQPQFRNRVNLYAKASQISFYAGEVQAAKNSGFNAATRILADAEHCQDCLNYAALGAVRLENVILPKTKCACMVNCLCSLTFSNIPTEPTRQPEIRKDIKKQILSLSPKQIKELVDDYKLDTKGNANVLKQRFIDFVSTKNQIQLDNIEKYILQVRDRIK